MEPKILPRKYKTRRSPLGSQSFVNVRDIAMIRQSDFSCLESSMVCVWFRFGSVFQFSLLGP